MRPGWRALYPPCPPCFPRNGYSVASFQPFRNGSHVLHPDSNGFHLAVRSGTVERLRRSLQQAARRRHLTEDRSDTSFGRTCPAMAWPARDRDRDERSTR